MLYPTSLTNMLFIAESIAAAFTLAQPALQTPKETAEEVQRHTPQAAIANGPERSR